MRESDLEALARARYNERTAEERARYLEASRKYYRFRHLPEMRLAPRDSDERSIRSPVNEANQLLCKYLDSPDPTFGCRHKPRRAASGGAGHAKGYGRMASGSDEWRSSTSER